ncbi:MAG TPA: hypothetical protein VLI54_03995 [Bacillota bacterium]|nr:hypothetical protein [Bacillota bacterium]
MSSVSILESKGYTLQDYEGLWRAAEVGRGDFSDLEVQALGVLRCADRSVLPLYDASTEEYSPDRNYSFCGPYQRQLAQVIKEDTGVQLAQAGAYTPHLQLHINRLGESDDQTSLVYYVGDGTAIILDGVIRLVKGAMQPGRSALHVAWTQVDDLPLEFAGMGLTPLSDVSIYGQAIVSQEQLYPGTVPFPYDEMERIMHTDEAYDNFVTLSKGELIDVRSFWGPRMRAVYAGVRRRMIAAAI